MLNVSRRREERDDDGDERVNGSRSVSFARTRMWTSRSGAREMLISPWESSWAVDVDGSCIIVSCIRSRAKHSAESKAKKRFRESVGWQHRVRSSVESTMLALYMAKRRVGSEKKNLLFTIFQKGKRLLMFLLFSNALSDILCVHRVRVIHTFFASTNFARFFSSPPPQSSSPRCASRLSLLRFSFSLSLISHSINSAPFNRLSPSSLPAAPFDGFTKYSTSQIRSFSAVNKGSEARTAQRARTKREEKMPWEEYHRWTGWVWGGGRRWGERMWNVWMGGKHIFKDEKLYMWELKMAGECHERERARAEKRAGSVLALIWWGELFSLAIQRGFSCDCLHLPT